MDTARAVAPLILMRIILSLTRGKEGVEAAVAEVEGGVVVEQIAELQERLLQLDQLVVQD